MAHAGPAHRHPGVQIVKACRAIAFVLAVLLAPHAASAQGTILQGGTFTARHAPMYIGGGIQAIVQDSGPAGGGTNNLGLAELLLVMAGTGTPPYAGTGTGPLGTNLCDYDGPTVGGTGYHYLCFSPNAQGGGLITYGAGGGASVLPFNININGTSYALPFSIGGIVGPSPTVVGDILCWNNLVGTLAKSCGAATLLAPLASPSFTGIPLAPTAATGTSTTQIATTAFVAASVAPVISSPPTGAYAVATGDCGKTLSFTGNVQATVTVAASAGFSATCVIHIANDDPFSGGRGRLISASGVTNFWLYPGQAFDLANRNSAWQVQNFPLRWRAPAGSSITLYVDPSTGLDASDGLASGYGSGAFQSVLQAWNTCRDRTDGVCGVQVKPGSTIAGAIGELDGDTFGQGMRLIPISGDPSLVNPVTIAIPAASSGIILRDGAWSTISGFKFLTGGNNSIGVNIQQDALADIGSNQWLQFPLGEAILVDDKADSNVTSNQTILSTGAQSTSWMVVSNGAKAIIGNVTFTGDGSPITMTNGFISVQNQGRVLFPSGAPTFTGFGTVTGAPYSLYYGSLISLSGAVLPGTTGALIDTTSIVVGQQSAAPLIMPQGRLSLGSGVQVMTTTQAAKGTLYYIGFLGNAIPYYNGSVDLYESLANFSNQVSTAMATAGAGVLNAGQVFDAWWVHSGANRLCIATSGAGQGWAGDGGSNTARGAGYTQLDHFTRAYVTNANAITHCYNGAVDYGPVSANQATHLGTIATDSGAAGKVTWQYGVNGAPPTPGIFNVWNRYNQRRVTTQFGETTASWTYATAVWRAINGDTTTARVTYTVGDAYDSVIAIIDTQGVEAGGVNCAGGIGVDVTNASTGTSGYISGTVAGSQAAHYTGIPGTGQHFIAGLELATGATCTFNGALAGYLQSGVTVELPPM